MFMVINTPTTAQVAPLNKFMKVIQVWSVFLVVAHLKFHECHAQNNNGYGLRLSTKAMEEEDDVVRQGVKGYQRPTSNTHGKQHSYHLRGNKYEIRSRNPYKDVDEQGEPTNLKESHNNPMKDNNQELPMNARRRTLTQKNIRGQRNFFREHHMMTPTLSEPNDQKDKERHITQQGQASTKRRKSSANSKGRRKVAEEFTHNKRDNDEYDQQATNDPQIFTPSGSEGTIIQTPVGEGTYDYNHAKEQLLLENPVAVADPYQYTQLNGETGLLNYEQLQTEPIRGDFQVLQFGDVINKNSQYNAQEQVYLQPQISKNLNEGVTENTGIGHDILNVNNEHHGHDDYNQEVKYNIGEEGQVQVNENNKGGYLIEEQQHYQYTQLKNSPQLEVNIPVEKYHDLSQNYQHHTHIPQSGEPHGVEGQVYHKPELIKPLIINQNENMKLEELNYHTQEGIKLNNDHMTQAIIVEHKPEINYAPVINYDQHEKEPKVVAHIQEVKPIHAINVEQKPYVETHYNVEQNHKVSLPIQDHIVKHVPAFHPVFTTGIFKKISDSQLPKPLVEVEIKPQPINGHEKLNVLHKPIIETVVKSLPIHGHSQQTNLLKPVIEVQLKPLPVQRHNSGVKSEVITLTKEPVHQTYKEVVDYHAHPSYRFDYAVSDYKTGDNKHQWEARDGDKLRGQYSLHEPDGTQRVVDYWVDGLKGFQVRVQRHGTAKHPASVIINRQSRKHKRRISTTPSPAKAKRKIKVN